MRRMVCGPNRKTTTSTGEITEMARLPRIRAVAAAAAAAAAEGGGLKGEDRTEDQDPGADEAASESTPLTQHGDSLATRESDEGEEVAGWEGDPAAIEKIQNLLLMVPVDLEKLRNLAWEKGGYQVGVLCGVYDSTLPGGRLHKGYYMSRCCDNEGMHASAYVPEETKKCSRKSQQCYPALGFPWSFAHLASSIGQSLTKATMVRFAKTDAPNARYASCMQERRATDGEHVTAYSFLHSSNRLIQPDSCCL